MKKGTKKAVKPGVPSQETLAADLSARCYAITHGKEEGDKKQTPQEKRDLEIVKAAHEVGGCATPNLIKLLEIVAGHPLPVWEADKDRLYFKPGTVIILTGNTNGHDYELGVPLLVVDGSRGINAQGVTGNYLPIGNAAEFTKNGRKATKAEIAGLFDNLVPIVTTPLGGGFLWSGVFSEYAPKFLRSIGL